MIGDVICCGRSMQLLVSYTFVVPDINCLLHPSCASHTSVQKQGRALCINFSLIFIDSKSCMKTSRFCPISAVITSHISGCLETCWKLVKMPLLKFLTQSGSSICHRRQLTIPFHLGATMGIEAVLYCIWQ